MENKKLVLEGLKKMRENVNLLVVGLCYLNNTVNRGIVYHQTNEYIKSHRPFSGCLSGAYWWAKGDKAPRIKWLDQHIIKLEKSMKNEH